MKPEQILNKLRETGAPEAAVRLVASRPYLLSRFAFIQALQEARGELFDELRADELQALDDLNDALLSNYNRLYAETVDLMEQQTFN